MLWAHPGWQKVSLTPLKHTNSFYAKLTVWFFSIVKITSDMVFKERWGKQVLDINELHEKMLEFEVVISHLKLRELHTQVSFLTTELFNIIWTTYNKKIMLDGLLPWSFDWQPTRVYFQNVWELSEKECSCKSSKAYPEYSNNQNYYNIVEELWVESEVLVQVWGSSTKKLGNPFTQDQRGQGKRWIYHHLSVQGRFVHFSNRAYPF